MPHIRKRPGVVVHRPLECHDALLQGVVAVDTETTGISPYLEDMPFMVAACWYTREGQLQMRYWEWPVNPFTREVCPSEGDIAEIRELFEGFGKFVFHNAKFDRQMLAKLGVEVKGEIHDTSFMARICSTDEMTYGLKPLAKKYLSAEDPLCNDDDEKALKDALTKCRRRAGRKGWKSADDAAADYWMVRQASALGLSLEREDLCSQYCLRDVYRTLRLWKFYSELMDCEQQIFKDGKETWRQAYEKERALVEVVMKMEDRGFFISRERAAFQLRTSEERVKSLLTTIQRDSKGMVQNPSSSTQLVKFLYGKPPDGLGLKCVRTTAKGNMSTDYTALRHHLDNLFVQNVVLYRNADKAIDTFFRKYLDMMRLDPISGEEGVIHTSLNQCGTTTGRFSSNNPNLQQVANPESSRKGTDIHGRDPFGPRPGYVLYCADYSKQESVVFADCAQVKGMLATIRAGEDINNYITNTAWGGKGNRAALEAAADSLELGSREPTNALIQTVWDELGWSEEASRTWGVRSDRAFEVADAWLARFRYKIVEAELSIDKKVSRARGKTVLFAKIYGGGAGSVTELLYCSYAEAERFMKNLERPFPEIARYMNEMQAHARRHGCIINKYGRRLAVNPRFAYKAVNYMVQGTCADMMKSSMLRCARFLEEADIDGHIIMTVHDELIFEIRADHCYTWVLHGLKACMEDTSDCALTVPISVDISRARVSWEVKEKLKL